ncbi:DM13 domain-containing protein [Galbibacter sp. BG1]|uniref:DM13 domain-containing protein n=1 Tax=Galbibacter sp. BG1 TaxID=1170699 RepID=UPI0015C173F3|nr:DM13 domain-containing protein [Galbibacter sp. BG1]QLE01190.1 DM13 domain-containing protein [Galbibacter sp. BG1]
MKATVLTIILIVLTSVYATAQEGSEWVEKVYSIKGNWSIVENDGKFMFRLGSNFNTLPGPELKLYLSPKGIHEINERDAVHQQGGLLIAELQSNKGRQEYPFPEGTNLADFKSLVIHCEKFSVVWGGIDLSKE